MATVQFQIHADKENTQAIGHRQGVQGGKTFQRGAQQSHKTPRRALGSVNEAHRVDGRTLPLPDLKKDNSGSTPGFTLMPRKGITERKNSSQQKSQEDGELRAQPVEIQGKASVCQKPVQQQSVPSSGLPDIEYMPPPSPPRDEDLDILPFKERASTYVNLFINSWHPQCLCGARAESDDEGDEEELRSVMEELDNLALPVEGDYIPSADVHLSCEELDLDNVELPSMDDIVVVSP